MLFFRIYIYNACGCLQQAVRDLKLVFRVYSGRGEFRFQTHTANEFSAVLLLLWAKIVNLYTRTGAPAHDEDNTYSEYQSAMTDGIQMTKEKKNTFHFHVLRIGWRYRTYLLLVAAHSHYIGNVYLRRTGENAATDYFFFSGEKIRPEMPTRLSLDDPVGEIERTQKTQRFLFLQELKKKKKETIIHCFFVFREDFLFFFLLMIVSRALFAHVR